MLARGGASAIVTEGNAAVETRIALYANLESLVVSEFRTVTVNGVGRGTWRIGCALRRNALEFP